MVAETTNTGTHPTPIKRVRSTSFPFNSLPESVGFAKEFAKYGDSIDATSLATVLGHQSPKSGSFLQKVSSLRDWHFLEGRGGVLTVTELSRRLANPLNDNQYKESLREAFNQCKVFRAFLDGLTPGSEFKREMIGNLAIQKYGVSHNARAYFVASLVASAEAAGLITDVTGDSFRLSNDTPAAAEDPVGADAATSDITGAAARPFRKPHELSEGPVPSPIIADTWPIQGGAISFGIASNQPLSAATYARVARVVQSIEELARELGWDREASTHAPTTGGSDGTPD